VISIYVRVKIRVMVRDKASKSFMSPATIGGGAIMFVGRPSVVRPLTPISRNEISLYCGEGFQWHLAHISTENYICHLFFKQAVRQISNIGRAYDLKQTASQIRAEINRKFFTSLAKWTNFYTANICRCMYFCIYFSVFVLLPC